MTYHDATMMSVVCFRSEAGLNSSSCTAMLDVHALPENPFHGVSHSCTSHIFAHHLWPVCRWSFKPNLKSLDLGIVSAPFCPLCSLCPSMPSSGSAGTTLIWLRKWSLLSGQPDERGAVLYSLPASFVDICQEGLTRHLEVEERLKLIMLSCSVLWLQDVARNCEKLQENASYCNEKKTTRTCRFDGS